ncbi:MAG: hypothetical protein R3321_11115, partial [Nitrososphaeraceae archaeon]|nr:hypothetical protein [Nitrososphaeraceae archaeon]
MKTITKLMFTAVLCLFLSHFSFGQNEGKKYENPQWKQIVYIKYEPGKFGEAMKIVKDYYMEAGKKAGTPSPEMMLEMKSGEWDLMIVWHMKGGIADMDWEVSPDGDK